MRLLPLLGALCALGAPAAAQAPKPYFLENRGQLDEEARFVLRLPDMLAFVTGEGLRLRLDPAGPARPGAHLFLTFEGARPGATVKGVGELDGRVHIYRGQEAWRDLQTYSAVRYEGIYPGVDVLMHVRDGRLEYDLLLAPGADPGDIVLRLAGADGAALDDGGGLEVSTAAGMLRHDVPATWEVEASGARRELSCALRLLPGEDGEVRFGFDVSGRDASRPLVIDPVLVFSTYLGATLDDAAVDVCVQPDGTATVVGWTASPVFPVTPGVFDETHNGVQDAFVTRVTADGSALVFSTYLGGVGSDDATAVAVDAAGNTCVVGTTFSEDFPVTIGAFDGVLGGGFLASDGFLAVLDGAGGLSYATYIGGTDSELCSAVAEISGGRWCVVGGTNSSDFVTTAGAYDTVLNNGAGDAFVAVLDPAGGGAADLVYGSFLGGGDYDVAWGVAVEPGGDLLLTGHTMSPDFPVSLDAFDKTVAEGKGDAFVARLSAQGLGAADLVWASFLGGSTIDHGLDIAADATGSSWITGYTTSSDFPTTTGSHDASANGLDDAFLAHVSSDGTTLIWSTYFGGSDLDQAFSISVDGAGVATIAGWTASTDLRTTPGAYAETHAGGTWDHFIAKFDAAGQGVQYATYFGGSAAEFGGGLFVDTNGRTYLVGLTDSQDFPVTAGAFDTTPAFFSSDGFLAALDIPSSPWSVQDYALAGTGGLAPKLTGTGTLVGGSAGALTLSDALPSSASVLFIDLVGIYLPAFKGTLVPGLTFPPISVPVLADGTFPLMWPAWPVGLPAGLQLYFQWWVADPAAPQGFSSSNAIIATLP